MLRPGKLELKLPREVLPQSPQMEAMRNLPRITTGH
jgi:hypothetical protein